MLDFTRVIAGPYSTRVLADFGAEIIKIEEPVSGDHTRSEIAWGRNVRFMGYNYGKKSVALNLKDPSGRDVAMRLAVVSDVVVENFRPGVMDRLGLGYEDLRAVNPGIIFCSISGFGQDSPQAGRPLHAGMAHALSGIMRMDGGEPRHVPAAIGDPITAIHAVGAICAALYYRERTGLGQRIDLALLETVFAMMGPIAESYSVAGGAQRPAPGGDRSTNTVPAGMFRGRDGYIYTGGGVEDQMWQRLARAMGRADIADKPHSWRRENQVLVYSLIDDWIMSFESVDEVERILAEAGVVVGKVRTVDEALADQGLRQRGMIVPMQDSLTGPFEATATAYHFSATPPKIAGLPPGLGEHSDWVMRDLLGADAESTVALHDAGVLYSEARPEGLK